MEENHQDTAASEMAEPEVKQTLPQHSSQENTKSSHKRRRRVMRVLIWVTIGLGGLILLGVLGAIWGWPGVLLFFVLIGLLLLVARLNRKRAIIKRLRTPARAITKGLGVFGYDKETKEYTPDGQLVKITKEYQSGKTLWDWLQFVGVLLIPLVIFLATMSFNQQQAVLTQDQQRDAILQKYLDNIQDLLLNHSLLKSGSDSDVAILARARTLTALQVLDPERKGHLLTFLAEAGLIGSYELTGHIQADYKILPPIIDLSGADLSGAHLSGTPLDGTNLNHVDLSGADLSGAHLSYTNLSFADLSGANLSGATLKGADLSFADLSGAELDQGVLWEIATCQGAEMPADIYTGTLCQQR